MIDIYTVLVFILIFLRVILLYELPPLISYFLGYSGDNGISSSDLKLVDIEH